MTSTNPAWKRVNSVDFMCRGRTPRSPAIYNCLMWGRANAVRPYKGSVFRRGAQCAPALYIVEQHPGRPVPLPFVGAAFGSPPSYMGAADSQRPHLLSCCILWNDALDVLEHRGCSFVGRDAPGAPRALRPTAKVATCLQKQNIDFETERLCKSWHMWYTMGIGCDGNFF